MPEKNYNVKICAGCHNRCEEIALRSGAFFYICWRCKMIYDVTVDFKPFGTELFGHSSLYDMVKIKE